MKGNVDETTTSYRYRQKSPSQYDDFITLSYAHGVRIIIGIKGKAKTNKDLSFLSKPNKKENEINNTSVNNEIVKKPKKPKKTIIDYLNNPPIET